MKIKENFLQMEQVVDLKVFFTHVMIFWKGTKLLKVKRFFASYSTVKKQEYDQLKSENFSSLRSFTCFRRVEKGQLHVRQELLNVVFQRMTFS